MRVRSIGVKKGGWTLLIVAVILLSFLSMQSSLVSSQGSVGVDNDGPSFINVSVVDEVDRIFVHVALRDLNGWDDIYLVNLTVLDNENRPISQVLYRQYASPSEVTPVIEWVEIEGTMLDREYCVWEAVSIYPWNPFYEKDIGLNVTFAFQSFPGERITVVALDRGEDVDPSDPMNNERKNLLSCEFEAPFSADFTPPPIVSNFVVPLALSFIIAMVAAVIMTVRRFYSNKLAKAIEAKEAAAAED